MARAALIAVLMVLALAARAQAASCCGSVLALGDRLGPGEGMSLQLGLLGQHQLGWFDSQRAYHTDPLGSRTIDGRVGASFARRFASEWQAVLGVAWAQGYRAERGASSVGGFLSDTILTARHEPDAWERWAFTANLTLPTGRTVAESRTPLVADATGRGMFGLRLAAAFEQPIESWFVLAQLGAEALGPNRDGGTRAGVAGDVLLLAGYTFSNAAAVSAGVRTTFTQFFTTEGLGGQTQTTTALLSGGYPFSGRWTLAGSVAIDPPVPVIGAGTLARVTVSLGLRAVLQKL